MFDDRTSSSPQILVILLTPKYWQAISKPAAFELKLQWGMASIRKVFVLITNRPAQRRFSFFFTFSISTSAHPLSHFWPLPLPMTPLSPSPILYHSCSPNFTYSHCMRHLSSNPSSHSLTCAKISLSINIP